MLVLRLSKASPYARINLAAVDLVRSDIYAIGQYFRSPGPSPMVIVVAQRVAASSGLSAYILSFECETSYRVFWDNRSGNSSYPGCAQISDAWCQGAGPEVHCMTPKLQKVLFASGFQQRLAIAEDSAFPLRTEGSMIDDELEEPWSSKHSKFQRSILPTSRR